MPATVQSIRQTFTEHRPAGGLAGHVTCVWILHVARGSAPYAHRTVPNGSAEIVCRVGGPPRISGPRTGPSAQVVGGGTTVVGLRLRPWAVASVLGVPGSAIVDQDLDAGDLWGAPAAALAEAVAAAGSALAAARAIERAVAGRLAGGPGPDLLAAEAVRRLSAPDPVGVGALAASLFISERQLRRRCEAAVGVGPKALHRMLRFQRFLALAGTHEEPSGHIAALAAAAGYADQSHLTREAARLDGRSPRALLLAAERDCRCGHDHAVTYGPLLRGG